MKQTKTAVLATSVIIALILAASVYIHKPPVEQAQSMCTEGMTVMPSEDISYVCRDGAWALSGKMGQQFAEREAHRVDLYWALRTRLLTKAEMKEVQEYGYDLTVRMSGNMSDSFNEAEKRREFNEALMGQARLQLLANSLKAR